MMKKLQITAQQIMQAALNIAAEKGAGKVTLDAVAKASGLSKGGLLYHFPSKEALISAMVQHLLDDAEKNRCSLAESESSVLVSLLKARRVFTQAVAGNTAMAILAAAAEHPTLLQPIQQHNKKVLAEVLSDPATELETMLLMLASEGLIFQELLSISPFSEAQKTTLEQYMINRAQELTT
ncbi:TetR/AcrR family transcriptional regulator [Alishewanella tabrizica]|uniref:TetR family transcriptional regulator n=1 Tax=Alishewanella tabrizica TaxID=671278 RepID=A0ABQ2WC55_9ALTE|nr:TetR/AcrR family transcriptional regulator [Alishewanella tabrizica]GGW49340.1 TetR family transcriptional regulator [Alishewanella tabrizica]